MPFLQDPPIARETVNNRSCLQNIDFALAELRRLESLGCISRVSPGECLVNIPLSVVFSNKLRLVVDCSRHINPFVQKRKVKLDSLCQFSLLVHQGDFVAVDDLDSGYWHVPLSRQQWKFFGCSIVNPDTGKKEFFRWKVV